MKSRDISRKSLLLSIASCAAVGAGAITACGDDALEIDQTREGETSEACTVAPPSKPLIGEPTLFESGHVRPLALSANGQRLYSVNTPDHRVEVFDVSGVRPVAIESIPVGLEPVAVALAPDGKLWVVNHLSDSISVVDVSTSPARIINTLNVGDEPRDIVFAGPGNSWAFITAAHRGQNAPFNPQLATEGVGRADVWVFHTGNLGAALGGTPLTILTMFGDTLRGLARSADGTRVYASVLYSGNRTTVLTDDLRIGGIAKAPPFIAADGTHQPATGLIVQFNGTSWMDGGDPYTGAAPRNWSSRVNLSLPDYDVFSILATGAAPRLGPRASGVGTTLFNLAVNPVSGVVYASNLEARNLTRFEGPGTRGSTVRGHFAENRITVIGGGLVGGGGAPTVAPRHLNKHITSYDAAVGTAAERALSLSTPLQMAVTADGTRLYVAAMGSGKLGRYSTAQLEADTFTPSAADQLSLSGGAPTGVILDEARHRAFVSTRLDNGISQVSTQSFTEVAHVRMFTPEPAQVISGRRFLYDAAHTSSRGDSACSGCHIFGDLDQLAWDLGDPDEVTTQNPSPYNALIPPQIRKTTFHPMKGPMATQSLRGLRGNGPMHWRGDRTGASRSAGETVEEQAFEDFNVAFTGLLGRAAPLAEAEMDAFAKFALRLTYPPNPIANLDGSHTPAQAAGAQIYTTLVSDGLTRCNGCHVLEPQKGHFGTEGLMTNEGLVTDEDMKIPHLRNMYQKVGMFAENTQAAGFSHLGDQIRGFGFDHAGAAGSVDVFLQDPIFTLDAIQRAQVEQFLLAFPTELFPIVGQQVTVTSANASRGDVQGRLDLLVARASLTGPRRECELVARATAGDQLLGWVMNPGQRFVPDLHNAAAVTAPQLLAQVFAAGGVVTFTCTPPGNGTRIGTDRDADGIPNRNDPTP